MLQNLLRKRMTDIGGGSLDGFNRCSVHHLCLVGDELTSVDAISDVLSLDLDTSLGTSTGAHGQGEAGVLIADHGSDIVWSIVGSSADGLSGRAVNHNASWVGRITLLGGDNLHATGGEGIAIDVGEIIGDLAISPGEFELRDRSTASSVGSQLDRDANTLLRVTLGVRSLEGLHVGMVVLANGGIVDGISTVVDDGGSAQGHDSGSRGKQHGCA